MNILTNENQMISSLDVSDRGIDTGFDSCLGLIGINHQKAPVSIREKASLILKANQWMLPKAREDGLISGGLLLSTCNRAEVLFSSPASAFSKAQSFMRDSLFGSKNSSNSSLLDQSLFYSLMENEVPPHVFRLATGLDSMIPGEAQILGQLKQAYRKSNESDLLESLLHRLCQGAFRTAKKVRTCTGIGKGHVSIASASCEAIKGVFGDFSNLKVLLIGAGETGTLVSRYLHSSGVKHFFIANRTQRSASDLSSTLDGVHISLSDISNVLPLVDVVITAIDRNNYILNKENFQSVLGDNTSKIMSVIDLSVPRVVDPEVSDFSNIYLFDIDDFSKITSSNLEIRLSEVSKADKIIQEEVDRFNLWRKERSSDNILGKVFSKINNISSIEMLKTKKSIERLNVSEETKLEIISIIQKHDKALFSKIFNDFFADLRKV